MSTALYRRYRPETFAEVIGQEQVTQPLMTALEKNRVNHAYLFSGPRGCGKTTSARILARCLNCALGPTPTPCGECPSCKELARDGGGSLDVIEMDAASHGGVDHARDLRERATFAPVRDRYKIFIIDEAHMVTREGFNALLKIVEEPPEHIKFIFATTEPNKVLGTIRSRTHHYPFRLVPPEVLGNYLKQVCAQEQVEVADGVLPLVVRAGGGSVRDSLSILDQLIAGSAQGSISYDLAVALLGFTHAQLLDQVVDALVAEDSAALFASVDRVVQSGQDPRRFVEDLLERFRDLIIVRAVPESAGSILRDISADQLERLQAQAQRLGAAELSRAADISNETLNEMSGAMNPQLQLELLCARLLLASADQGLVGLAARLDRLEKRLAQGASVPAPAAQPAQAPVALQPPAGRQEPQELEAGQVSSAPAQQSQPPQPVQGLTAPPLAPAGQASQPLTAPPLASPPLASPPLAPSAPTSQAPAQQAPVSQPLAPQEPAQQISPPADPAGPGTLELVQTNWERVLAQLENPHAKAQFALCQPVRYQSGQLFLLAEMAVLKAVKNHLPLLQAALQQVLGLDVRLRGQVKRPGEGGGGVQPPTPGPQDPGPSAGPSEAPLAAGPRGDEAAWAAHGQPRSNQPPSWSQDDWNNPVTSWQVAPIPQDDQPPAPVAESQQAPTQEAPVAAPLASPPLSPVAASPAPSAPAAVPEGQEAGPLPAPLPASQAYSEQAPEPSPQLRVVQGGPDPVEFSKAHHPSQEQQPVQLAPAPDPAPVQAQPAQPEQKLSFRQRHAQDFEAGQRQVQQRQQASQATATPPEPEDFSPSEDDKPLESAVLIGQKAVEKILGGKVIDEQPLHQPV